MDTLSLLPLLFLAGFVLFPTITGFATWRRERPDRIWETVSAWAVVTAALLIVNAGVLWDGTPAGWDAALLTMRHLLIIPSSLLVLLLMFQLCDQRPWWAFWTLTVLLVGRAVLWLTTDLYFAHTFTADGTPVYGPLRSPLALIGAVLLLGQAAYIVTRRPWKSELARRSLVYALFPSVLLMGLSFLGGRFGEYLQAVIAVPAVLALQMLYLAEFRRDHRRQRLIAAREARLAGFGTAVLAESPSAPEQQAAGLVSDVLAAPCRYTTADLPLPDDATIRVPVDVAGTTTGYLDVAVADPTEDDRSFVQATAALLSAGMSRSLAEQRIRQGTLHDSLTGLPNWALLSDRLAQVLDDERLLPVAVLAADLRGLGEINDESGRAVGDAVLCGVARRLEQLVSPRGTLARIGGDRFVLVQPRCGAAAAERLAQRARSFAAVPIEAESAVVRPEVRVGFTVADGSVDDPDRIVRDAEMATMLAKRDDTGVLAFSNELREHLTGRRRMAAELAKAIGSGGITVVYQPIVDLGTGRIRSVEALARWRARSGDEVPPDVFVPLAEETQVMAALGRVVLDQAFADLAAWAAAEPACASLRLNVNVTPSQVVDPSFAVELHELLARHGLPAQRVTLEVAESALDSVADEFEAGIRAVRALGMGLSLDDFGSGHASLVRLMTLPVGELKLDRRFVRSIGGSARNIVPAIVGLAHSSGLRVVAEGVEQPDQRDLVRAHGCDDAQGHVFGRELAAAAVPEQVRHSLPAADDPVSPGLAAAD